LFLNAVSPTWMRVTENFDEELLTGWRSNAEVFSGFDDDGLPIYRTPQQNIFNNTIYDEILFSLRTPGRLSAGLAYFLGKSGFITADVEYVNYGGISFSNARFSMLDFDLGLDFTGDNRTIENIYQSVFNYRVGAEFRKGIFRFRGGFAFYGNPFEGNATGIQIKTVNTQDGEITFFEDAFNDTGSRGNARFNYTGGLGIRKNNFYADFAIVLESFYSHARPYTFADLDAGAFTNPRATINQNRTRALMSFGFFY